MTTGPGSGALDLLREGMAVLAAAGIEGARRDAEWLLAGTLGLERFGVYLDPARRLGPATQARYLDLVTRRAAREPLQYLLGFEDFDGLRLAVGPDVLIPRPETEGLVQWAVEALLPREAPIVADVGTGSGAIACALARRLPRARVVALDRSLAALAMAARNVRALGLSARVRLVAADLLEPVGPRGGALDLVIANPPYIESGAVASLPAEVSAFEPRIALDGGPDGTAVLRRLVTAAPAVLRPGGWLMMEIGEGQAGAMAVHMAAQGFVRIATRRDLRGTERYVAGQRSERTAPASRGDC